MDRTIVKIGPEHIKDVSVSNQPFLIIGKILPRYENGVWTCEEVFFPEPKEKKYPDDEIDCSEYIDSPDRAIFLCYAEEECTGHIRVERNWNKFCFVKDFAVARSWRRNGIGRELMDTAVDWARSNGMQGMMLETQDVNLIACRFYHQYGYRIGAVDTMLYANFDTREEKAVFWYLSF